MQEQYRNEQGSGSSGDLRFFEADDAGYDEDDDGHTHQRPDSIDPAVECLGRAGFGNRGVDSDADGERDQNDLDHRLQERPCVHGQPCPGEPLREQRGGYDGDGGRGECEENAKRDIGACEVAYDVGGGATGTAAYEDEADGETGFELESACYGPCRERHDEELCSYSDEDGSGLAGDVDEVGKAEGKSHAEHDDAEARFDVGLEPGPCGWLKPGPETAENDPQRKGAGSEKEGAVHGGWGGMDRTVFSVLPPREWCRRRSPRHRCSRGWET